MGDAARRTAEDPALADHDVVRRVVAGDHPLFEILVRRHNQRVFRVARGILGDDAEAEDVAQEAHLRAFRGLKGFRGEARYATWLTRIAVHEAMSRVKRRRRLVAVDDPEAVAGPRIESDDPEHGAGTRELARYLERAIDALPDALRAVFSLREVEGLSSEETAELLDISAENVRVRLHRARGALRESLDRAMGEEARRLYLIAGPRCDRIVDAVMRRIAEPPTGPEPGVRPPRRPGLSPAGRPTSS